IHKEKLPDDFYMIGGLRVDPKYRETGIGKALLNEILNSIRNNSRGARLSIYSWNKPSMNLALTGGFKRIDEYRIIADSHYSMDNSFRSKIQGNLITESKYFGNFKCHFVDWKYVCMNIDDIGKYYIDAEIIIPDENTIINIMKSDDETEIVVNDAADLSRIIKAPSDRDDGTIFYIRNKIIKRSKGPVIDDSDPIYLNIYEIRFFDGI
ncbi:MAG: GNAT family N-acetyltransferase, partial [Thermoplasmata archaeon]